MQCSSSPISQRRHTLIRTVSTNNAPQCDEDFPMIISNVDDDPDTFVNFELEAPFMGSCEVFGIPTTDTDCDENEGRTMSKYTAVWCEYIS